MIDKITWAAFALLLGLIIGSQAGIRKGRHLEREDAFWNRQAVGVVVNPDTGVVVRR